MTKIRTPRSSNGSGSPPYFTFAAHRADPFFRPLQSRWLVAAP